VWTPLVRSSLYYGMQHYNNDLTLTGADVGRSSNSWTANLIYAPLPKLEVGGEFRHATRTLETGANGTLNRLQLMTKYAF